MEFTNLDAPTTTDNGVIDTPTNGVTTNAPASDDVVIVDNNLSALESLSKSVYKAGKNPVSENLKQHLDKYEPALKEAAKKQTLSNPNGNNGLPKATPQEVKEKPEDVKTTAPVQEAGKQPVVQKPTKLFQKPTVVESGTTAPDPKYFISAEADAMLKQRIESKVGSIKDLPSFFDEWLGSARQKLSKFGEMERNYTQLNADINNAPRPVVDYLLANKRGDFTGMREALTKLNNHVDYSRPFSEQVKVAAAKYMPSLNITDENGDNYIDFDDPLDSKVKSLKDAIENLWNKDKEAMEHRATQAKAEEEAFRDKATKSLTTQLKSLSELVPDDFEGKEGFMKGVDKIWRTPSGIDLMFFDKDGQPLENAVERSFYAMYGQDIIAWLQNALYEVETEKQNLIASGVGKTVPQPPAERNFVNGSGQDLVKDTRKSITPYKDRYERI